MEVVPGKWIARDDRRSEMLPFGAAKKRALRLYHSKGKGTPRNGIADLNRAIVAEIDREDPPSFKRHLRGWITALADGSYRVRVVPTNETQQLFAIESTADPECDTAKALLDRGITGNCILLDSNTGWLITHFDIDDRARLASRSAASSPPSEPEHRCATPGAIQGDDYQLEYYEDGYPKLPVCLDRRTPNSLLEQPKQLLVLDQILAKAPADAEGSAC
jgi:hypothetical protein